MTPQLPRLRQLLSPSVTASIAFILLTSLWHKDRNTAASSFFSRIFQWLSAKFVPFECQSPLLIFDLSQGLNLKLGLTIE